LVQQVVNPLDVSSRQALIQGWQVCVQGGFQGAQQVIDTGAVTNEFGSPLGAEVMKLIGGHVKEGMAIL
jgi:hypothetical protein